MPEPMDLDYIENDLENEAEGLTPYWAEVVTYLLSEAKQVKIAHESVQEAWAGADKVIVFHCQECSEMFEEPVRRFMESPGPSVMAPALCKDCGHQDDD